MIEGSIEHGGARRWTLSFSTDVEGLPNRMWLRGGPCHPEARSARRLGQSATGRSNRTAITARTVESAEKRVSPEGTKCAPNVFLSGASSDRTTTTDTPCPFLQQEPDLYPEGPFLCHFELTQSSDSEAWALYCLSNKEKAIMRRLRALDIPHYGPLVARRYRSPAGRVRTSYVPLFAGYVFLFGDEAQRYHAKCTGYVSRCIEVLDAQQLTEDLNQIYRLIEIGAPLTAEERLVPGMHVRIRSGAFAGFEGTIIQRNKETRLLVAIDFLQQGASVLMDDCQVEYLG